jgi:NADH dehydrogenase FAD-containing subunit
LAYDQLVLALGSRTNRHVIPGAEHAFTFKTLADALLLRNHVIERFERADVETDPQRKAQLLTFVVIGGGLVGVELLGELTAFVDGITPLYEHVNRDEIRFLLVQGAGRIMPEIDRRWRVRRECSPEAAEWTTGPTPGCRPSGRARSTWRKKLSPRTRSSWRRNAPTRW